jgi:anaerobic selenocysteine-containing dehydrogenase
MVANGWVEAERQLPADWVERHLDRLGGWRLAPRLLVEQLAALEQPAALVLVPRRQPRHLNSQLTYLGDAAEVVLHPDDASVAAVTDGQEVVVRTDRGEIRAVARVDPAVRVGAVSVPHGYEGVNVNVLTDKDDIDVLTGMAHYSGLAVEVRPTT